MTDVAERLTRFKRAREMKNRKGNEEALRLTLRGGDDDAVRSCVLKSRNVESRSDRARRGGKIEEVGSRVLVSRTNRPRCTLHVDHVSSSPSSTFHCSPSTADCVRISVLLFLE